MSTADMVNDQLVLIAGESAAGKSAALMNMRNQEKGLYLGTEAGKRLPFRSKFDEKKITDPYQVMEGLQYMAANPDKYDYVMIDSLTFMMDMMESRHVLTAKDTQQAWGAFQQFFKTLMQRDVATLNVPVIFTAHTKQEFNDALGRYEVSVPVKGALKHNGVEAYFSTVVHARRASIRELEDVKNYDEKLLTITDLERELGFKHVFQTQVTKTTIGHRIRSPLGMFSPQQVYMNNDAQMLLDHMNAYYA